MKYYFKLSMLLPVGLLTAVVLYPFLHEAGHLACAVAFGAKPVGFSLFLQPGVSCAAGELSDTQQFLVALAGPAAPLLLCAIKKSGRFWVNYIKLLIVVISFLSFSTSAVGLFFRPELLLEQDDIVRFSAPITGGMEISVCICIVGIVISVILLTKTLKRCRIFDYFTE